MSTKSVFVVVLVLLITAGGILYRRKAPFPSDTVSMITLEDIRKHADESSCWMAVEGVVYDTTKLINRHENKDRQAFLQGCGTDATVLFLNRKGEGPHPQKAQNVLQLYKIGLLKL